MDRIAGKNRAPSRKQGVPPGRRRFIARAETLKEDPTFLGEIKRARSEWNEWFPQYRLDSRVNVPEADEDEDPDGRLFRSLRLYPAKLEEAIVAYDRLSDQERRAERRRSVSRWHLLGEAMEWWHDMLDSITSQMWPPDDFPHAQPFHPALLFVSLCVAYDIASVPTSIAFAHRPGPLWAPSPPGNRDVQGIMANLQVLINGLGSVASGEVSLTPEAAESLLRAGELANHNASTEQPPDPKSGFWYVPIGPDLTGPQWRAMELRAREASHDRFVTAYGDVVDARIRFWKERGLSHKAIADRLGISDDAVSRSLRKPQI